MTKLPKTAPVIAGLGGVLAGPLVRLAILAALVGLALAMTPLRDQILALAGAGRLRAPDLALVTRLSPAIQAHLYAALAALALGAVLMAARKGRAFHRTAGWAWVGLVTVTAVTSLFITELNGDAWSLIHLLTGWTLLVLPLGVIWAQRRQVARHRKAMMGLFYGGFAINLAFTFIPGRTLWMIFFA